MNMLVIVPTRGRPESMVRQAGQLDAMRTRCDVLYAVDDDDPQAMEYARLSGPLGSDALFGLHLAIGPRLRLVGTLNFHAVRAVGGYDVIGFMGDDHLPRTDQWDQRILDRFLPEEPQVVYGNDLLQGEHLATAVFMSARVVKALGYFSPPGLTHLYADNAWMEIGRATNLAYLPDVVIEHMHPAAGKAAMDDGYREVNAPAVDQADRLEFERWRRDDLTDGLRRLLKEYG